jgi:hypothetical protein
MLFYVYLATYGRLCKSTRGSQVMAVAQAVPTVQQLVQTLLSAVLTGHHHRNDTVYVETLMLS